MTTASGDRGADWAPAAQTADRQGAPPSATVVVVLDMSSGRQGRAAAGVPARMRVADATLRVRVALELELGVGDST